MGTKRIVGTVLAVLGAIVILSTLYVVTRRQPQAYAQGLEPAPGALNEMIRTRLRATADAGQDAPPMERLEFLSGCWQGSFESERGPGTIEERYTSAAGGLILGTTRYILDGEALQFEFSRITADSTGTIALLPYPGGVASEHSFRVVSLSADEVVFEAPEHDFPKRIRYRRDGARLEARVDAGEGTGGQEWEMERVACEGVDPAVASPRGYGS